VCLFPAASVILSLGFTVVYLIALWLVTARLTATVINRRAPAQHKSIALSPKATLSMLTPNMQQVWHASTLPLTGLMRSRINQARVGVCFSCLMISRLCL